MTSENSSTVGGEPERINIETAGVMVRIPSGDFCMGDIAGSGEPDEQPVLAVQVNVFWLARHEVTREQFKNFVIAADYTSDAELDDGAQAGCLAVDPDNWSFKYRADYNWITPGFNQTSAHPVVCVSYNDALAYIVWLNEQTGLLFRLPTEAEWEYTARAGTRTTYPWGKSATNGCKHANIADQRAWPGYTESPFGRIDCDDGHSFTAPVGSYAANAFGIFDTSGNVWEWTADCWWKSYAVTEVTDTCALRAFRGSSWMNSAKSLRSANRSKNGPSDRLNTVGFRLALDHAAPAIAIDVSINQGTSYRK